MKKKNIIFFKVFFCKLWSVDPYLVHEIENKWNNTVFLLI